MDVDLRLGRWRGKRIEKHVIKDKIDMTGGGPNDQEKGS